MNEKVKTKARVICFSIGEIEAIFASGLFDLQNIIFLSDKSNCEINSCLIFLDLADISVSRNKTAVIYFILRSIFLNEKLIVPINLLRNHRGRLLKKLLGKKLFFVGDSPAPRYNATVLDCHGAQVVSTNDDYVSYKNAKQIRYEVNKFKSHVLKKSQSEYSEKEYVLFLTKKVSEPSREKIRKYLLGTNEKVQIKVHPRDDYEYWQSVAQETDHLNVTQEYWVELLLSSKKALGIHSSIAYYAHILNKTYSEIDFSQEFCTWDTKNGNRWADFVQNTIKL